MRDREKIGGGTLEPTFTSGTRVDWAGQGGLNSGIGSPSLSPQDGELEERMEPVTTKVKKTKTLLPSTSLM